MPKYEFAHVGINHGHPTAAEETCQLFAQAFGFPAHELPGSYFVTRNMEVLKSAAHGSHGHIGIYTDSIEEAIADLHSKGFAIDMETAAYNGEQMVSVYLQQPFGGFGVHLLLRPTR